MALLDKESVKKLPYEEYEGLMAAELYKIGFNEQNVKTLFYDSAMASIFFSYGEYYEGVWVHKEKHGY